MAALGYSTTCRSLYASGSLMDQSERHECRDYYNPLFLMRFPAFSTFAEESKQRRWQAPATNPSKT